MILEFPGEISLPNHLHDGVLRASIDITQKKTKMKRSSQELIEFLTIIIPLYKY